MECVHNSIAQNSGGEKLWRISDFKVLARSFGECYTPVLLAGEKLWRI